MGYIHSQIFHTINDFVTGTRGQDSVSQVPPELTVQEGWTVILNCSYTTKYSFPNLLWYIQHLGDAPRYLLKIHSTGDGEESPDFPDRISADLDLDRKAVPLTITGVCVSDSAVYHCALIPTLLQRHSQSVQKPTKTLSPPLTESDL